MPELHLTCSPTSSAFIGSQPNDRKTGSISCPSVRAFASFPSPPVLLHTTRKLVKEFGNLDNRIDKTVRFFKIHVENLIATLLTPPCSLSQHAATCPLPTSSIHGSSAEHRSTA